LRNKKKTQYSKQMMTNRSIKTDGGFYFIVFFI
jgi:hypothetical protein